MVTIIKTTLKASILLCFIVVGVLLSSSASAEEIIQNFDTSATGTSIASFGWTNGAGSSGLQGAVVSASTSISFPNGMTRAVNTGSGGAVIKTFGSSTQGVASIYFRSYPDANFEGTFFTLMNATSSSSYSELQIYFARSSGIECGQNSEENLGTYTTGVWYEAYIEWRTADNGDTEARCGFSGGGGGLILSSWRGSANGYHDVGGIQINANAGWAGGITIDNVYIATDSDWVPPTSVGVATSQEYDTRFTNAVASSTGTDVEVGYFIEMSEVIESNPARNIDAVQLRYAIGSSSTLYSVLQTITPDQGNSTTTIDVSGLTDGTYDMQARFYNIGCSIGGVCPFDKTYLYFTVVISGGNIISMSTVEKYNTDTYNEVTTEQPCSLTQIQGCVINAFVYLFVPTDAHLQNFVDAHDELQVRYPFSWFYGVAEVVEGINVTTAESFPTYTLNVPFLGTEFPILSQGIIDTYIGDDARILFRNIMAWALWLGFFVMVFFTIGLSFGLVRTEEDHTPQGYGSSYKSRASH